MLLSTNVGLLAIQSIDNTAESTSRSLAQIASYVSALMSVAVLLVIHLLRRQYHSHQPEAELFVPPALVIQFLTYNESSALTLITS